MTLVRRWLASLVVLAWACSSAPRAKPDAEPGAAEMTAPASEPAQADTPAPAPAQSEEQAIALVCDAPKTCPECLVAGDRHKTLFAVEAKYGPSITHPDARVLWEAVKNVDAQGIVTVLRTGAAGCPLADWMEQQPATEGPTFTLRGALSEDRVLSVIRSHMNEVQACYHQVVPTEPRPEAEVTVKFIIQPDGHVQLAAVLDRTPIDYKVEMCIVKLVQTWTFDKPAEKIAVVTYPFRLK